MGTTPALLIGGGMLIDGTGAAPRPADVLVDGDEIVAVGPHAADRAPDGVVRIDAGGATVMPGLIDAHCHLTFDEPRRPGLPPGGVTRGAHAVVPRRNAAARAVVAPGSCGAPPLAPDTTTARHDH